LVKYAVSKLWTIKLCFAYIDTLVLTSQVYYVFRNSSSV